MSYAVRVKDEYVGLMGRYVAEGQAIVPGVPLMDVMTPEGVVETILAECWGVVAHVEGGRVFFNSDNENYERAEDDDEDDDDQGESGAARSGSGGKGAVYAKGDVICHIVERQFKGGSRDGRLHPRPSGMGFKIRTGRVAAPN